jgi:hypothetical protein
MLQRIRHLSNDTRFLMVSWLGDPYSGKWYVDPRIDTR